MTDEHNDTIENTEGQIVPIVNPFAAPLNKDLNAGAVTIESERAIADVKAKLTLAKMFPRNKAEAYTRVMDTCSRPTFAKAATYAYPRGGETVSGPSIRLAEELARDWGNCEFGIAELAEYSDGDKSATEVMAFCWDLETNVMSKQTFRSPHERHKRDRSVTTLTDPRDIYENNANLGARRLRSRILAIIPPDLVEDAVKKCRDTLAGNSSVPLSQRVNNIVREFGKMDIALGHIERRLGHRLEDILPEEYADLVGIYTSLKDGMTKPADWFDVPKTQGASETASAATERFAKKPLTPEVIAKSEAVVEDSKAANATPEMATLHNRMELVNLYLTKLNEKKSAGTDFKSMTNAEALELIAAMSAQPDYQQ